MTTRRSLALCSALVLALAVPPTASATPVWTTDTYDPAQWTASSNNVLLGVTAGGSVSIYTEGGKTLSTDTATLTDGVVPGAGVDYTKIFGIVGGALEWTFNSATTIAELRIFTRWGDGGRDGINITSVAVKYAADGDWVTLSSVPSVNYGNGNDGTSGHLSAILLDPTGDPLATEVFGLKLAFGTQDNNGSGYAEIEALAPETGAVRAIVTRKYIAPRKAALEVTLVNCGEGGSSANFYFAFGPTTNELPEATCYTNGLVQGDSFEIPLTGLALNTSYSFLYYAVNNLSATSSVGSGSFSTPDGSTTTWLGLASDNWSDGMNWDTEIAPAGQIAKVILNTPAGCHTPANLDITGLSINDLCFGSDCTGDFTVSGAAVTLKQLSSQAGAAGTATIHNNVTFNGTGYNNMNNGSMTVRFEGVVSGGSPSGGFESHSYGNIHFRNPDNDFVGKVFFNLGTFSFCDDGCLGMPPAEPTEGYLETSFGAIVLDKLAGANLHQTRLHPNRVPRGTIFLCDGTELFYDGEIPSYVDYRHSGNDIKHVHLGGTAKTLESTNFAETSIRFDGNLLAIMGSDTAFGDATRGVHSSLGSVIDFNGHSTAARITNYGSGYYGAPNFINSDREHETVLSGDISLGYDHNTRFFGGPGAIRVECAISEDASRHLYWSGPGKLTFAGTNVAWSGGTQLMGGSVDLDYRTNTEPKLPAGSFGISDCHLRLLGHPTEATSIQPESIFLNIHAGGLSVLEAASTGANTTLQIGSISGMGRNSMVDFRTDASAGGTASIIITNMANNATFGGIGPNYTWDRGRNWAYINVDGTVGPMPESLFSSSFESDTFWDIPAGETEITTAWLMPNGIRIAGTSGPTTLTISQPVTMKRCGAENVGGILIASDAGGDVVIDGASSINPENYNGGLVIQNWNTNYTTRLSVRFEETNDNDFSIVGPGTTILDNDNNSYYYGPHAFGGGTLKFTSITNSGSASALGKGNNNAGEIQCGSGCVYEYIGTTVEGHTSNRRFTLHGDGTLKASGAGPLVLNGEGPVASAYASSRLILDGNGVGVIEGGINPGRFGSVLKRGSGTWTLNTTTSAYEYPTVIEAGTLQVQGTLPSSVEVEAGGTLEACGLVVKRDLDVAGTVRFDVTQLEAQPVPLVVWGTARLNGEFQVAGRLAEPTVVLTAENGIEGTFSNVPSNIKLYYAQTSVTAAASGGTVLVVR